MLEFILIFSALMVIFGFTLKIGIKLGFSIVIKMIKASPQDWKYVIEILGKDKASEEEIILLKRCIKNSAGEYVKRLKE